MTAQACVNSVNKILVVQNMRPVTLKEYKSKIEFPVINMYKDSGFDFGKESFDDLSEEYVQNYLDQFDSIDLHDDARSVLTGFKNLGLKQYIVSASGYQILWTVERYGLKEFLHKSWDRTTIEGGKQGPPCPKTCREFELQSRRNSFYRRYPS